MRKTLSQTLCAAFSAILCAALPLEGLPFAALAEKGGGVMLIGMRNAMFSGGGKLSAEDYVQDGLYLMLDGIENVGIGMPHSYLATSWADLSGHGRNAQLLNGCTWTANSIYVHGKSSDSIVKTAGPPSNTNFTLECVHKMDSRDNYARLWDTEAYQNTARFASLFGTSLAPDNMCFIVDRSVDLNYNMIPVSTAARSFSVVPQTSSNKLGLRAFVNGQDIQVVFPIVSPDEHPPSSTIDFGNRSNNPNRGFDGAIFAIRIYNRILTPAEIATNYAVDVARFNLPTA